MDGPRLDRLLELRLEFVVAVLARGVWRNGYSGMHLFFVPLEQVAAGSVELVTCGDEMAPRLVPRNLGPHLRPNESVQIEHLYGRSPVSARASSRSVRRIPNLLKSTYGSACGGRRAGGE